MLQQKEFNILSVIEENNKKLSQRELAKLTNLSIGTVNSTIAKLEENNLINEGKITQQGLSELEPYKVKKIIFIAAGFSSRLAPITLNTPKPLIRVNGQRIIDSMLDTAINLGIEEIYIVRGHLSEQFDQLTYKYPNIKFIDNPKYNEENNISSAFCAKDFFQNAYICEADIVLKNPHLLKKYQYNSNYCGVKCERTDDWCLFENKGKITGVSVGGINGYRMVGISYWTENDGKKLSEYVERVYNMPGGKERYWDDVPLTYFIDDFNLYIRECTNEDFIEIDTFKELKAIDSVYNI